MRELLDSPVTLGIVFWYLFARCVIMPVFVIVTFYVLVINQRVNRYIKGKIAEIQDAFGGAE